MTFKRVLFVENNATEQNADEVRLMLKGLLGGVTSTTSGVPHPDHLKVSEKSGTPNMSVDIAAGHLFIEGSRNSAQGTYHVYNDAVINMPLSASDPTNPRIDIIYVRVRDSAYDAGFAGMDDADPEVKQGTAAAVPVAPTITDSDYVELARVTVPAAASSIVNANVADTRPRTPPTRYAVSAYRFAAFNIPASASITVLPYDTEEYDYGSHYNPTTGIYTASVAGLYRFTAAIEWGAANNPEDIYVGLRFTGAGIVLQARDRVTVRGATGGDDYGNQCAKVIAMNAGQQMEAVVGHVLGGNPVGLNVNDRATCYFTADKVG